MAIKKVSFPVNWSLNLLCELLNCYSHHGDDLLTVKIKTLNGGT